jgi:hypothetical protein
MRAFRLVAWAGAMAAVLLALGCATAPPPTHETWDLPLPPVIYAE